jgi:hypothetical protein
MKIKKNAWTHVLDEKKKRPRENARTIEDFFE